MKTVKIALEDTVLKGLVVEQLRQMKNISLADENPDLVIAKVKTDERVPHLLLGGKAEEDCDVLALPLRLGEMNDRIMYRLSGRARFASDGIIALRHYTLNAQDGVMTDEAKNLSVRLTDKEKLLILSLFNAPDHAIDRASLLQEVWSYAENAETHTLETHLYRLRQKLEEAFGVTDLIVTKDGVYTLKI